MARENETNNREVELLRSIDSHLEELIAMLNKIVLSLEKNASMGSSQGVGYTGYTK
jgi:hypothetical protein